MDELSEEQAEELRGRLADLVAVLERGLRESASSAKPEAPFCVTCQQSFRES
jgi:hypothetical protein